MMKITIEAPLKYGKSQVAYRITEMLASELPFCKIENLDIDKGQNPEYKGLPECIKEVQITTKASPRVEVSDPKDRMTKIGEWCCHRCYDEYTKTEEFNDPFHTNMGMIICKTCGNKRCPKATDHRLECTHSNEPNQPGSIY